MDNTGKKLVIADDIWDYTIRVFLFSLISFSLCSCFHLNVNLSLGICGLSIIIGICFRNVDKKKSTKLNFIFLLCKMQKLRIVHYLKTFATQQKWKRTVKLVDFILSSFLSCSFYKFTYFYESFFVINFPCRPSFLVNNHQFDYQNIKEIYFLKNSMEGSPHLKIRFKRPINGYKSIKLNGENPDKIESFLKDLKKQGIRISIESNIISENEKMKQEFNDQ